MKKQKNKNFRKSFFSGILLFILGILGIFWHLNNQQNLDVSKLFPQETLFLTEIDLNKKSLEQFSNLFEKDDFLKLVDETLSQKFSLSFSEDLIPWIGKKMGIGVLKNGDLVMALKYKDVRKTRKFLNNFKTPEEEFSIKKIENGEIWTAPYSSQMFFGFTKGWLLIAKKEASLKNIIGKTSSLNQQLKYKDLFEDLPKNNFLLTYFDIEKLEKIFTRSEKLKQYQPILEAFSLTMPEMGMIVNVDKKGLVFESKFKTHKGVFSLNEIQKTPNKTIPDLAKYSPKNTLFFINGSDLYSKYLHTKNFLSDLNEQFPIIFDGLLRAQSREIFGEEFDFENDFLAKMRGQYAFLIDFENSLYPFLDFTFLSGFGGLDTEQNLSQFHEAIHYAQSRFAPQIQEVELPDGTKREELISAKPEEIPIRKVEYENKEYFTAQNLVSDKKFSYGFVENNFVFSTHEEGIKSVIAVSEKTRSNLAENSDFRDSVLFKFSPSESYGFVNFSKLISGFELLSEVDSESVWSQFLKLNIRNITFARKVFPEAVFFKAILFTR